MKKIILKSLLALLLTLTFQGFAFATTLPDDFAQRKEESFALLINLNPENCRFLLTGENGYYDLLTLEFQNFLQTTFQNKSSTSTLLNIAIAKYSEIKNQLDASVQFLNNNFKPTGSFGGNGGQLEQTRAYDNCINIKENYVATLKDLMVSEIKKNASQKKTLIILEKYKGINERLRSMSMNISQTYALFKTFNNKLPGFLRKCVQ